MFNAAGFVCVVRRTLEFKQLCGYVGIPRSHPLYEVDRCELIPSPEDWRNGIGWDIDEHGAIDTFVTLLQDHAGEIPVGFAPLNMLIGVHGGLTWSDRLYDHTGWWFGFHCGHAYDFMPGLAELITEAGRDASFLYGMSTYRTFDYVKQECATLAQRIADWSARIPHIEHAREAIRAAREAHKVAGC
jgi:hypothetical protein